MSFDWRKEVEKQRKREEQKRLKAQLAEPAPSEIPAGGGRGVEDNPPPRATGLQQGPATTGNPQGRPAGNVAKQEDGPEKSAAAQSGSAPSAAAGGEPDTALARMIALARTGLPPRLIARELGMSTPSVSSALSRARARGEVIPYAVGFDPARETKTARIAALTEAGLATEAIAATVGTSAKYVREARARERASRADKRPAPEPMVNAAAPRPQALPGMAGGGRVAARLAAAGRKARVEKALCIFCPDESRKCAEESRRTVGRAVIVRMRCPCKLERTWTRNEVVR